MPLLLTLLLTSTGWSWSAQGHRHVAEVAQSQVSEETRVVLDAMLDGATLADLSTRLDERRIDAGWAWSKPLHYVNLPPDALTYDRARDCADGRCVVEAIRWYAHRFHAADASPYESLLALEMLTHLVGDIHQPLHVGLAEDRGGNDIEVVWEGETTDLHSVWDDHLPQQTGALAVIEVEPVAGDPVAWANESWALTRSVATPQNGVTPAWVTQMTPIVSQRTSLAGARLAWLLDRGVAGDLPFEQPDVRYPTGRIGQWADWFPVGVALVLLIGGGGLVARRLQTLQQDA